MSPVSGLTSRLLSLGLGRASARRLTVLLYHDVGDRPWGLRVGQTPIAEFRQMLSLLARYCSVLPLAEAVERLQHNDLPPAAVAISFDDGYRDTVDASVPLLQEFGFSATYFVVGSSLDGVPMWSDRVLAGLEAYDGDRLDLSGNGLGTIHTATWSAKQAAGRALLDRCSSWSSQDQLALAETIEAVCDQPLPSAPLVRDADVQRLREAGMDVGCHTWSHPVLTHLDESELRNELMRGKQRLEAALSYCDQPTTVDLLAYPVGKPGVDVGEREANAARDLGFKAAFTTGWGAASCDSDPWFLPRFMPWPGSDLRHLLRLVYNARWLTAQNSSDFPAPRSKLAE